MDGFGLQLFLDQQDVASTQHVKITYHTAKKHESSPVLVADRPWEQLNAKSEPGQVPSVATWGGGVIYDEQQQLFKMWYGCLSGLAYATSRDGVHWKKPALGLKNVPGRREDAGPESNVMLGPTEVFGIHCNRQEPDPQRRFKTIRSYGLVMFSPDGIRWNEYGTIDTCGKGPPNTTNFDPGRGRYVGFPREYPIVADGSQRISVRLAVSTDFLNWQRVGDTLLPDELDDRRADRVIEERKRLLCFNDPDVRRASFYVVYGYPYGDHHYIGLAQMHYASGYTRINNWQQRKAKETMAAAGVCEIQLISSRDLRCWQRHPQRKPLIEQGPLLSWDGGEKNTGQMCIYQDKIWIYYSGGFWTHDNPFHYGPAEDENWYTLLPEVQANGPAYGIGLATLRLDGFVSADACEQPGTLNTRHMQLRGVQLSINASAPNGQVAVEVLDQQGRVMPGFSKNDCQPFTGDELRHTVRWKDHACLGSLLDQPVALRFHLKDASLYSYTIGG